MGEIDRKERFAHINDDERQPWRECIQCGAITMHWHLQTFGRDEDTKDANFEQYASTYQRYVCDECAKETKKRWTEIMGERMQEEMK